MRIRPWPRRRRPLAAPKLTVSKQVSWRVRLSRMALLFFIIGALALWTYELGRGMNVLGAGISAEQAQLLKAQTAKALAERDQVSGALGTLENQLAMERAAHTQLAAQVQSLTAENARLQEDLAFFDSLVPAGPVSEKTEPFQLEFQRYQRIEGILPLPEGVQVRNVQARVLENGKVRAQQSANMER
jgi:hypothetical protein